MKVLFVTILFLFPVYQKVHADEQETLQSKVDAAPPYGILEIPEGYYHESLIINKPLEIRSNGSATLHSCSQKPTLTIKRKDIVIDGLKIEQCTRKEDVPAIYVSGENHVLRNMQVTTSQVGIKLEDAFHTKIEDGSVKGEKTGNGIDLWHSDDNSIRNMDIRFVQDGIYMQESNNLNIFDNFIQQARYGLHVMYSDQLTIANNISSKNSTGAMVMVSDGTVIKNNRLVDNQSNVHAQGLLLYDVSNSSIRNNHIMSNRLGIYIEESQSNQLTDNEIRNNHIGIQFKNAEKNLLSENAFINNVNEIQAIGSSANHLTGNYWDSSLKVDTDGSGKSAISYRADPYFLSLTNEVPDYQLFFQSPGMLLLQKLLKSPDDEVLTDDSPSMSPSITGTNSNNMSDSLNVEIIGSLLLTVGTLLFILGRN